MEGPETVIPGGTTSVPWYSPSYPRGYPEEESDPQQSLEPWGSSPLRHWMGICLKSYVNTLVATTGQALMESTLLTVELDSSLILCSDMGGVA